MDLAIGAGDGRERLHVGFHERVVQLERGRHASSYLARNHRVAGSIEGRMEPPRIEELRRYQASSRRIQRWSVRGLIAGLLGAVITGAVAGVQVGLPLAALAGIVGGAGFWITRGHIEEFEQQLRARGRR